jgi:hypothetical protein
MAATLTLFAISSAPPLSKQSTRQPWTVWLMSINADCRDLVAAGEMAEKRSVLASRGCGGA